MAFAVAGALSDNAQFGTFAAFGSFALLVFLDPPRRPARGWSRTGWWSPIGAVSITLATACSMTVGTAVLGMAVVGFGVLMAASLGSYAAGATTAVLLTFVLPVSIPVPWSELPWRLAGWGLAAALRSRPGCCCVGSPAPSRLRARAAESCRALGALLVAEARSDPVDRLAVEAATAAEALRAEFSLTPYRPGGAGDTDRALAVLADQLDWLAGVAAEVAAPTSAGTRAGARSTRSSRWPARCWTGARPVWSPRTPTSRSGPGCGRCGRRASGPRARRWTGSASTDGSR